MMPPKLLLFLSYTYALTIANLTWLVSLSLWSANFRESRTVQPVLLPVHFHMFTSVQYSDIFTGCLSEPKFPIRLHASVSTPSPPPFLLISLTLHLYSPSQSLRSSADTCLLKIPLCRCKSKGDRAFSYFGPSAWNSLPLHIRNATTIDTFWPALKIYLFNLQEPD